jgi:hypothetical protein
MTNVWPFRHLLSVFMVTVVGLSCSNGFLVVQQSGTVVWLDYHNPHTLLAPTPIQILLSSRTCTGGSTATTTTTSPRNTGRWCSSPKKSSDQDATQWAAEEEGYLSSSSTAETRMMETLHWTIQAAVTSSPVRAIVFSFLMTLSGALLGPLLDTYHSVLGVLQYDAPITAVLWGTDIQHPALVTAIWVPALFGLAGFLIGWMYVILDTFLAKGISTSTTLNAFDVDGLEPCQQFVTPSPSPPKILVGIALFTFQYWLSGVLFQFGADRTNILFIMSVSAIGGFWALDNTVAGLITSLATAMGGPVIEVGLLTLSRYNLLFHGSGYHYNDLGETGYFPFWIIPVYFLGGPANGNLARGYWSLLSPSKSSSLNISIPLRKPTVCVTCSDTRRVPCPNW